MATRTNRYRRGDKSTDIRIGYLGDKPSLIANWGGRIYGVPLSIHGSRNALRDSEFGNIRVKGDAVFDSGASVLRIKGDGVSIKESNIEVASFGVNTVITGGSITMRGTAGTVGDDRLVIGSASLAMYAANAKVLDITDGKISIGPAANAGATDGAVIGNIHLASGGAFIYGAAVDDYINVKSDGVDVYAANVLQAAFGATTTIGNTSTEHIKITGSTMDFKDSTSVMASMTGGSITLTGVIISGGSTPNVMFGKSQLDTGTWNIGLGNEALGSADRTSAADFNIGIGYQAGKGLTSGDKNICIGYTAGINITSGRDNVVIGDADVPTADADNQLVIASGDGTATWINGDASGNVAIGHTGPILSGLYTTSTRLTIYDATSDQRPILELAGNTDATDTAIGAIHFCNNDNTDNNSVDAESKLISQIIVQTVTSDDNGGEDCGSDMLFYTKPEAGGITSAMTIDSTQRVGIGTAGPSGALTVYANHTTEGNTLFLFRNLASSSTDAPMCAIRQNSATDDQACLHLDQRAQNATGLIVEKQLTDMNASDTMVDLDFSADDDCDGAYFIKFQDSNGEIGSIKADGAAAVAFNTSSDYRLKEDLKDIVDATGTINKLKLYDFKWKKTGRRSDGVIAHEVAEVYSQSVSGEKDAMTMKKYTDGDDETGRAIYKEKEVISPQVVDYSKFVPLLLKSIQELSAKFDSMDERLTNLEVA